MGAQADRYLTIDQKEIGMMVHTIGEQRDLRREKRAVSIGVEGIPTHDLTTLPSPLGEDGESLSDLGFAQFRRTSRL